MIVRMSSVVSVVGVYVGLLSELSIPNSFIKQCVIIVMGLVGVDNNILVMEGRHCLAAFKSLKIAYRPIAFCNSNLYQRPHTLYPFGMSILVFHFSFCSPESIRIIKKKGLSIPKR